MCHGKIAPKSSSEFVVTSVGHGVFLQLVILCALLGDGLASGVCKMYEEHLKRMNPNSPSITYDISQLFDFIDDLADLSCLVYRADTQTYQPYNKDWIKEKIYVLLRRQAQQAGK